MERRYFTLVILFVCCFLLSCCGDNPWEHGKYGNLYGVAVDDLNGDGKSDIAVAMKYVKDSTTGDEDSYATVLLNNTNSPVDFFPPEEYWLVEGSTSYSIAIGDLNDDGFPDIATQDWKNIYVLFQDLNSPGNFLNPLKIFVGSQVDSIVIGDLNEDALNDIAIAGFKGPHLSILFQDSTDPGNFLPLVSIGLSSGSVAIADLDGDFINDIAVTGGGLVKLLFQDPGAPGSFSTPVGLTVGNNPQDVKIGDLDKDGRLDLIVGYGYNFKGGISVLLQVSANPGEFLPADNYNISCSVRELSLGDLNDDGFLDIAVASWCKNGRITILLQDISNIGTFLPAIKYGSSDLPWSIAVNDMNNDNLNDLIISENATMIRLQDPALPGNFLGRTKIYDPD
jgi:hypothetical protein